MLKTLVVHDDVIIHVHGESSVHILNVVVTIDGVSKITDSNGECSFELENGSYTVEGLKQGDASYETSTWTIVVTDDDKYFDVQY